MSERSVSFVINRKQCMETGVETVVLQGSPLSLVMFAIYLSRVFTEMDTKVEGCVTTSFTNMVGRAAYKEKSMVI